MKPAELSYPEVSTQPEQLLEEHAWNSMENKGSLWRLHSTDCVINQDSVTDQTQSLSAAAQS